MKLPLPWSHSSRRAPPAHGRGADLRRGDERAAGRTNADLILTRLGRWIPIAIGAALAGLTPVPVSAASSTVVIAEIYGGGGLSGSPYRNDYIVLFNRGTTPVSVNAWSIQYASAGGTSWLVTTLPNLTIQPNRYFLVQEALGGTAGVPLPAPDAAGSINMGLSAGKVALVSHNTPLSGPCPLGPSVVDMVGYGVTANCFEGGAVAPTPSVPNSIQRRDGGCLDTDNNAGDFIAAPPAPRNSSTSPFSCGPAVPELTLVNLGRNAVGTHVSNGGGSHTIVGGGNDVWDNMDECSFAGQEVTGDFDVRVRVESLSPNARWTKAGLMIRETLAEDSRMAFNRVTPSAVPTSSGGLGANDTFLSYRTGVHEPTGFFGDDHNGGRHEDRDPGNPWPSPPYPNAWLRLARQGAQITAFNSADGVSWSFMAQVETSGWNGGPLKPTVLVGLAVSRHPGDGVTPSGPTATAEFRDYHIELGGDTLFGVAGASSRGNPTGVLVEFTHPVGPSAYDPTHYSLGGPSVFDAAPGPRAGTVQLTTSFLTEDQFIPVFVSSNVSDVNGQPLFGTQLVQFRHGEGYELRPIRIARNMIPGAEVSTFLNSVAYRRDLPTACQDLPAISPFVSQFADDTPNDQTHENYSARLSGLLRINVPGLYRFACASDDKGILYLSADDNPANKVPIAFEPEWSEPYAYASTLRRNPTNPENQSVPRALAPGDYYLEYTFSEGGGGNHASVTWDFGGGAPFVDGQSPLSAGEFTPFRMYAGTVFFTLGPVFVRADPTNQFVDAGFSATFHVQADGTPPYALQWLRNGSPIAGANGFSYTTPPLSAGDDGTLYSVRINNEFSSVTSSTARVSVTASAPFIEVQPQDQTVPDCGLAQFEVVASGASPLAYQWRRNGVPVPGGTNQTLVLPGVGLTNAGNYTVRVSNFGGAVTSLVAQLVVLNAPPAVTAPPPVTVPADAGLCSASSVILGTAGATDECGPLPVSHNAPPVFPLGVTAVTWTAVDRNGVAASALQNVTVTDRQPPAVTLPGNLIAECNGPAGTPVSFAATASDNCGGSVPVSYSHPPGSLFPPGVTTVNVTAGDTNGNATNRSFTVTVTDTTAPTVTVPPGVIAECAGAAGTPVSFAASATDACGGELPVNYSHAPGSLFPTGVTTVNVTATDSAGNSTTLEFNVTVRDTTAPRGVVCLDPPVLIEQGGRGGPSNTPAMPRADLLASLQGQPARSYDQTTPGAVFVHSWENVTDCVTDSTLEIGVAATGPASADDVVSLGFAEDGQFVPVWSGRLGVDGPPHLAALTEGPWLSGMQAVITLDLSRLPLEEGATVDLIGLLAQRRYLDIAIGNDTTVDFTALTIGSCRDRADVLVNNEPGLAGATVFYEYAAFVEACGGAPLVSSPFPPGSFFPIGETLVPMIATDSQGHVGRSWFRVICRDVEPPILECPTNPIVECAKPGGAPVFYTVQGRDNSGNVLIQCDPPSGGFFPIGTTLVNCSAADPAGHVVECSFPATLTLAPPTSIRPVSLQARLSGGSVELSFPSQEALLYRIEYNENLAAGGWQELTQASGSGGPVVLTDPVGSGTSRFYRVRASLGGASGGSNPGAGSLFEPPEPPPAQPGSSEPRRPGPDAPPFVYLFSGEFHHETTDLRIKGRGLDFVWTRKYRSCPCIANPMGHRWDYSYNICVVRNGPDLDVFDGHTRQDTYFAKPDGTFVADQFFREGRLLADNRFVLTFADGGRWIFRPLDSGAGQGRIARIEDRNGNALRFDYDASGRLTNVIDTLDRNIRVSYDADGFIDAVIDFTGRQVRYSHYQHGEAGGSFGDLRSATSPAVTGTPHGNDFPDGKTVTYTYTQGGGDPQQDHLLLTITDGKGQTWLRNTYAPPAGGFCNRVVRQAWGYTNDVLTYDYSALAPDPANRFAVTRTLVNDRAGNVREYHFDAGNRCVLHRAYTGRAVPGQFTTATQNRPRNKLRPGDPDYFETRYEWNADSMLTRVIHPNGNRTENVYELELDPGAARRARGNLRVHRRQPGPLGGDSAERVQTFDYEAGAAGCCNVISLTRHTDARGHVTLHSYDARGNRRQTRHRVPSAAEDWDYNEFGQVIEHILPDNGADWRRRDVFGYYKAGPQRGYLAEHIADAAGFALTTRFEHDAVGNVVRTVDPRGADTLYTVNALDQVVRETSREPAPGTGLRYRRDFYYDANDNRVREDVENRDELGALQANTHFTKLFDYEILNRVVRVAREKGSAHPLHGVLNYDALPFGLRPQFVAVEYAWDANRNRTHVRHGEATAGFDPANVTARTYDERDLLFRETRAPASPLQSTTEHAYDGNANRVRTASGIEQSPRLTQLTYDGYDRPTRITDAMGNLTTVHYDANHNRVAVRVDGELLDLNGAAGNRRLAETLYQYDPMDRPVRQDHATFDPRTQAPIGDGWASTVTSYNDNSQTTRVTDDRGNSTVTLYDTANRPGTVIDARSNRISYAYDEGGNVIVTTEIERSDLDNPVRTFSGTNRYDGLGRLTERVRAGGQTNRFAYDSRDNCVRESDALNHETLRVYDGLGRLVQTVRDMNGDGARAADPADLVIGRAWDDSDRLMAQTDGNGRITRYAHDALDRRIVTRLADGTMQRVGAGSVDWPDGNDRPAIDELFWNGHDVHGNVLMLTDANGTVVTATYDLLNRPLSRSIARAPGVLGETFENFQYDGASRLALARNDDTLVTRVHDSRGLLIRESINFDTPSFPSNRDRVTTWSHDGAGNPVACTYPGGRVVTRIYDELNRLKRVCDGACVNTLAEYFYIGPARTEALCYGNGTCGQLEYDAGRHVTGTLHAKTAAAVIDQRASGVDPNGNRTFQQDVRAGGPELSHAYSYDAINRLVRTVVASPLSPAERDSLYTLDRAGNRLNVTSDPPPGNYSLNPSLPDPADAQVNQYTRTPFDLGRQHSANGELTEILGAASAATYEYDHRGLLARVTDGGGTPVLYTHDALGRRVQRIHGTSVRRVFHDGDVELEEQDASGNTLATYVHGRDANERLSMRRGAADVFFHADDLRSLRVLSDADGNPVERYDYGDYGEPLIAGRVQAPDLAATFESDADGARRAADDFTFSRPLRVLAARWWGAYVPGPVPAADNFSLRIHASSAGLPGPILRLETPGNNVRRFATGRLFGSGQAEFIYEAVFASPFDAAAGTQYWLEIINNTAGQPASWAIGSAGYGGQVLATSANSGASWQTSAMNAALELFTDVSPIENPYLFAGRRHDPVSGLYHFAERWFDPVTGRFITRDPAGTWADPANLGNGYTLRSPATPENP